MTPLKVLVLNSGGSSVKCQLFDLPAGTSLAKGVVERVGQPASKLTVSRPGAAGLNAEFACPTHLEAVERIMTAFHDTQGGTLPPLPEVEVVGHRVVQAGEAFTGSVPVTPAVLDALEACCDLAPLHNPPNLTGIRACLQALPTCPQVCVFDNALHHTLPPAKYLYGLPRACYEQDRIRRYGFHGVAFRSMADEVERLVGRPADELRILNLMLGSGCTANALDHGRSVAISTGFTPLEGLVQSTRCGDLDAGMVLCLLRQGCTAGELNDVFNRRSGLLGLSGVSADLRDVLATDSDQVRLALDVFVHRLIQYVGRYTADLEGLDVLAFGGGIGQHSALVRERVCAPLGHLGLELDPARNRECVGGPTGVVSSAASRAAVVVCNVDEELVIARDSYRVVTSQ